MAKPEESEALQELVKQFYFQELEDKHKLDSRMPALVVIMSASLGLLYFAFNTYTPRAHWFLDVIVEGSLWVSVGQWIVAFLYLAWGTLLVEYQRVTSTGGMADTLARLQEYHQKYPDQPGTPDTGLHESLTKRMIQATDYNAAANIKRSARYHYVMIFMAGSIALALLAGGLVAVDEKHREKQKEEQTVADEKPKDSSGSTPQGSTKPAGQPSAGGEPAPAKPTLPPNAVFKGGEEPPGKRVITSETLKDGK